MRTCGCGDQVVQRPLFLDDSEDRAQLAQVVKLGLIEQVLRARRGQLRFFRLTRLGKDLPHGIAHFASRGDLIADVVELGGVDVLHDPAAQTRVERVGKAGQGVGIDLGLPLEDPLGGDPGRRHDDGQAGARRQPQQLDVFEGVRVARGRNRDREVPGKSRQQPSRLLDHVGELARRFAELDANTPRIVLGERFGGHQPVDVGPIAGVRGHAAGGGMRLHQITARLELGHLVTDGRRAHAEVVLLGERP